VSSTRIALSMLLAFGISSPASAHCIVGSRFFPATIIADLRKRSCRPPKECGNHGGSNYRTVPEADSSQQLSTLPIGGFGHPKSEDDQRQEGDSAQCEKGRTISEMIDDLAGGQPTQRGADPLHRCDAT
jgi:hypothetical protein